LQVYKYTYTKTEGRFKMLPFYYSAQVKTYVTHFMAIFAGMKVETGKREDGQKKQILVPIRYGDADRVVAYLKAGATQNKLLHLPIMSVVYNEFQLDETLRKGVNVERRKPYVPRGGLFPEDIKIAHQLMPIPYRLGVELSIYTSNTEQQLQLLEQIMILFDPTLTLQKNDNQFDWTRLATVRMDGINLENNTPIGAEKNMRIVKIQFSMPIYISAPANIKDDFVKDIMVRIGMVGNSAETSEEMIAELDAQGLEYEKWFSLDDIDITDEYELQENPD